MNEPWRAGVARPFDGEPFGIFFTEASGAIQDANDTFLALTGYTREDLDAGRLDWQAMTPAGYDRDLDVGMETLLEAGVLYGEKYFTRKNGTLVAIAIGCLITGDDLETGRGIAVVLDRSQQAQDAASRAWRVVDLERVLGDVVTRMGREDLLSRLSSRPGIYLVICRRCAEPVLRARSVGEDEAAAMRAHLRDCRPGLARDDDALRFDRLLRWFLVEKR